MTRITTKLFLATALVALAPLTAGAATQGTIPVGPDGVTGTIQPGGSTQIWKVALERDKVYALEADEDCQGVGNPVDLRAPGGAVLATGAVLCEAAGGTFRAPVTADYAVRVAPAMDPADYHLSVVRDCLGDTTTVCAIGVGQTLRNLQTTYLGDADAYRVSLRGGHTYVASITATADLLLVLDAKGHRIGYAEAGHGDRTVDLPFTAPRDGRYFIVATTGEDAFPPYAYDLSLTER